MLPLASALFLVGCQSGRGGPVPYDVKSFGQPDAPTAATLDQDYKIAPLDTLKVTVFQVPALSGEYEVSLTGELSMPLIGSVKVVDRTSQDVRTELVRRYHPNYLKNPDISVGIKASTRHSVTLDGAVAQPGMYPVNGSMTLLQAIATARGTSENANPRRVAVFRQIGGQRMAAAFDLTSIRRGEAEDPKIYSGDIVVVDGSDVKSIQKQLLQTLPILSVFRPF
jgi:polysaccharide export outer membrane protein